MKAEDYIKESWIIPLMEIEKKRYELCDDIQTWHMWRGFWPPTDDRSDSKDIVEP